MSALPQDADVPKPIEVGLSGQNIKPGARRWINQGWKHSGAIKTTERKLADKTLIHGGQALMAWAVSNACVEPKGNAIVITKQASGTAKIDPLMAAFSAVAWMSANPATSQPSIFVI
jgi:phage terminase large subunit-like protein